MLTEINVQKIKGIEMQAVQSGLHTTSKATQGVGGAWCVLQAGDVIYRTGIHTEAGYSITVVLHAPWDDTET